MAHRLIVQHRGRGSPTYTSPSFRFAGKISYANMPKKLRGEVLDLIDCPGHAAPLMLIKYEDGQTSLLPAAMGIYAGKEVFAGEGAAIETGNVNYLKNIPTGAFVFNLEVQPGDGGKLVRSSGGAAQILGKEIDKIIIKMPSRKEIVFNPECRATIGTIAGLGRVTKPMMKAGVKFHARHAKNKRYPRVSAIKMNIVDHPFGGSHDRHKGHPKTISRHAPPGQKTGLIAARRAGKKKK